MDLEIGHINVAVHSDEEKAKALKKAQLESGEDEAVLDWHTDSYPFVCVTMLSDCNGMVGGETVLRKGNGGEVKVRGPQMVSFNLPCYQERRSELTSIGICRHPPGPVYRAPCSARIRHKRAHHLGDFISAARICGQGRHSTYHSARYLAPQGVVSAVHRVPL